MKGDFSRQTFDAKKHYSAVLMQQGRVQVDADWNEQRSIDQHRIETQTQDVIGSCGAPLNAAGFAITTDGKTLTIAKGRYYVDGILCENEQDLNYRSQPDLPWTSDLAGLPTEEKLLGNPGGWVVYLDVWQRHLTALDDPLLREVALGGADTTTRTKTIWQVKLLPIALPDSSRQLETLRRRQAELQVELQKLRENQRFEEILEVQKKLAAIEQEIAAISLPLTCSTPLPEWDRLTRPSSGKLNVFTDSPTAPESPCLIPPSAGYQRLENQLYRVEIHQSDGAKTTFKWSRDNGSVVTAIVAISGQTITVQDVGLDEVLGFANGQWVELIDDLKDLSGQSGQLVQIEQVDPAARTITIRSDMPIAALDLSRHPQLRRWDQTGATATTAGVAISTSRVAIEGGIEVEFSNGTYKPGDYWLIPARTATGTVEWPDQANAPVPQPPLGIQHHYCRLALLGSARTRLILRNDCRLIFPPLTGQNAMHVIRTSWDNDDLLTLEELLKNGLEITLDAAPVQQEAGLRTVTPATLTVNLESPLGFNSPTTTADTSFILDGNISVSANTIRWFPVSQEISSLREFLLKERLLLRIRLRGNVIWSERGRDRLYLDGQALGQPGSNRRGTAEARTDLIFPSGTGMRSSDFESWLWLGNPLPG
ncbi:MAG TPA: DUF6519 domain-containing protein [Coleofasciculaceae cyanobacterium]|jgi:hypothetical protein